MVRRSFIAGNWKMHKTRSEAASLVRELIAAVKESPHKIMVAPPFTALETVGGLLRGSNILLGAQNMGPVELGAHTGEISPVMLKDLGVQVVILGHSERRHEYGENDELINRKVLLAMQNDLEVILCVGETLGERERGITEEIVNKQVREGLSSNRNPQLLSMREVQLSLTAWRMLLREEYLSVRPMYRPPVPQTTLQRPDLNPIELARMPLFQPFQDSCRPHHSVEVPPQYGLYLFRPDFDERVQPRSPVPYSLFLRR